MGQQLLNLGTVANDGTGDTVRDAGAKINDNFTELYTVLEGPQPVVSDEFTGNPSSYTPTASDLFVLKTDVTPKAIYRTTGTTAGSLEPLTLVGYLTLREQTGARATGADEIDLVNINGLFQWKNESNGALLTVAAIDRTQTFTGAQGSALVVLTDAATITTNASLSNVFVVTLGGNRTLETPTNLVAGFTYLWIINQDGTGGRTLAYSSAFLFPGGTDPILSTAASARDLLTCVAVSSGNLICTLTKAFS